LNDELIIQYCKDFILSTSWNPLLSSENSL
jgi:hypothetical protein